MKILVVEDDGEITKVVRRMLERDNHLVDAVDTLDQARAAIGGSTYDCLVIDRNLPDGDGLDILPHLPKVGVRPRTLMLTAMGTLKDRVQGLDSGADDYLLKPFEPIELLARIRALCRRPVEQAAEIITSGHISFDVQSFGVSVRGEKLSVPRRESIILLTLLRRAGSVVQRQAITAAVYGYDNEVESNSLEAQISRLRARLRDTNSGVAIHVVRGVGYLLDTECEP